MISLSVKPSELTMLHTNTNKITFDKINIVRLLYTIHRFNYFYGLSYTVTHFDKLFISHMQRKLELETVKYNKKLLRIKLLINKFN